MAQLPPDGRYKIQQIDGMVVLFDSYSSEELIRFDPSDRNDAAQAQGRICGLSNLEPEQKAFAHFWSGYFYAYAGATW
jgi:hypothetical protein